MKIHFFRLHIGNKTCIIAKKTQACKLVTFCIGRPAAAEVPMNVMTALLNIALIHIILVLVLAILVRKENSAFGHARSKGGVTAPG